MLLTLYFYYLGQKDDSQSCARACVHGVLDVHKHTQQNECLLHIQYFVIGKWNFLERVGGNLGHHKISDLFLKYMHRRHYCCNIQIRVFEPYLFEIHYPNQGWAILEIAGDDYHVLKYHDIQYYHNNAFWLSSCILFVPKQSSFYEVKHLNELCAYLSIKFQVMYA